MEKSTSNETMATEIITELKDKLHHCESAMDDCLSQLKSIKMALGMIKDKYEWSHIPDVKEAYKVYTTVGPHSENERLSMEYVSGYEEIMWLVNVALDYCFNAEKEILMEECE